MILSIFAERRLDEQDEHAEQAKALENYNRTHGPVRDSRVVHDIVIIDVDMVLGDEYAERKAEPHKEQIEVEYPAADEPFRDEQYEEDQHHA
jgi:hypothetical protein